MIKLDRLITPESPHLANFVEIVKALSKIQIRINKTTHTAIVYTNIALELTKGNKNQAKIPGAILIFCNRSLFKI